MWSPQGGHPRLPPWMPTLGFGVPPRCGEDNTTDEPTQMSGLLMHGLPGLTTMRHTRWHRQDKIGSHRPCASRCSNMSPYFKNPCVLWEAPQNTV